MDWFLHKSGFQPHQQQHNPAGHSQPVPVPAMVPQLQGDPTFLYGGFGYRPPTFGYAWTGASSQTTSFAQLPTDAGAASAKTVLSPKSLSKSVSAPDLQNPAAMLEMQKKAQRQQQQPHVKLQGTPPTVPRHHKHLTMGHAPPGTPGEQSAANTPSSSRASTPPRRGGISNDFYIGMAAA